MLGELKPHIQHNEAGLRIFHDDLRLSVDHSQSSPARLSPRGTATYGTHFYLRCDSVMHMRCVPSAASLTRDKGGLPKSCVAFHHVMPSDTRLPPNPRSDWVVAIRPASKRSSRYSQPNSRRKCEGSAEQKEESPPTQRAWATGTAKLGSGSERVLQSTKCEMSYRFVRIDDGIL